jgi:hypothetical protein
MNIFRFSGDMSHLLSFFLLGWRLWEQKNANGASPARGGRRGAAATVAQRRRPRPRLHARARARA